MSQKSNWLMCPQRRLGTVGCVAFLACTIMINALSFDMYIPAVPQMVQYFHSTDQVINITLSGFYAFNTLALLMAGPISDRVGRKPVLLAGAILYALGCAVCAISPNVPLLICSRVIQAVGAGSVAAVGTAITKDLFVPEKREAALSIVQITFVVGPVAAPLVGSLVLTLLNWRFIFWMLFVFDVIILILIILLDETLPTDKRTDETLGQNMLHLVDITRCKPFMLFLLTVATFNTAFSAYVACGSHVFVEMFGTTTFQFSLFFGFNAIICTLGPVIYMAVSKWTKPKMFTFILIGLGLATGILLLIFGQTSPFVFIGIFCIWSAAQGASRPYSTNLLLAQRTTDVGAASSVINFFHSVLGCLGMIFIVAPFPNYVIGIGSFMVGGMALSLVLFLTLLKGKDGLKGME